MLEEVGTSSLCEYEILYELTISYLKWTPLSRPFLEKNKTTFKIPRDGLPLAFDRPALGVVFDGYNS